MCAMSSVIAACGREKDTLERLKRFKTSFNQLPERPVAKGAWVLQHTKPRDWLTVDGAAHEMRMVQNLRVVRTFVTEADKPDVREWSAGVAKFVKEGIYYDQDDMDEGDAEDWMTHSLKFTPSHSLITPPLCAVCSSMGQWIDMRWAAAAVAGTTEEKALLEEEERLLANRKLTLKEKVQNAAERAAADKAAKRGEESGSEEEEEEGGEGEGHWREQHFDERMRKKIMEKRRAMGDDNPLGAGQGDGEEEEKEAEKESKKERKARKEEEKARKEETRVKKEALS
eukprot:gene23317-28215_t